MMYKIGNDLSLALRRWRKCEDISTSVYSKKKLNALLENVHFTVTVLHV